MSSDDNDLLYGRIILFKPKYEEPQECVCGSFVKNFTKHLKTKVHKQAEEKFSFSSQIDKKKKKSPDERKAYMREYMRKYNEKNPESYQKRKDKYKEYRRDNRVKCLEQMYDCRYRIQKGERKNYKEV